MIDYGILANAIKFYSTHGFKEIEVPWIVSKYASDITMPSDRTATAADCDVVTYHDPVLVGSAEQSFLQLRIDGKLPDGLYQATSPCFRDEWDDTHVPYFMKNELIYISKGRLTAAEVGMTLHPAFEYMKSIREDITTEQTSKNSWDIVTLGGLELGSYGVRYHSDIGYWIYGTGVALPRISMILP